MKEVCQYKGKLWSGSIRQFGIEVLVEDTGIRVENRERKGWDRKRIDNGWQTDSSRIR